MFERFTERARRVVVYAQEEARSLNHNYIGTEHILLGLLHETDGIAAQALESLNIDLVSTREEILHTIGRGQQSPSGQIPFTPRAKEVLEFSVREAIGIGHDYIGTEHILLGLLRESEGVGAQVLTAHGVELGMVRDRVGELLGADIPAVSTELAPIGSLGRSVVWHGTPGSPGPPGELGLSVASLIVIVLTLLVGEGEPLALRVGLALVGVGLLLATASYVTRLWGFTRSGRMAIATWLNVAATLILATSALLLLVSTVV